MMRRSSGSTYVGLSSAVVVMIGVYSLLQHRDVAERRDRLAELAKLNVEEMGHAESSSSSSRSLLIQRRQIPGRHPPRRQEPQQAIERSTAKDEEYSGYTFWSSDFHIAPVADLKDIFGPLGMEIIDESLSGHCHLKGTCARNLKVLNKGNGIHLNPCPNQLRRKFFDAYKQDPRMRSVDAFLCHHAAGMCEVFMPFNASLIVVVSTRYEIGRHEPKRWQAWNENLKAIARNPRNLVAANNLYDAEYVKYFTGLQDVPVVPNLCGYVDVNVKRSRREILIGPGRGVHETLANEFKAKGRNHGFTLKKIRELYPNFKYSDLAAHQAIVLLPYQVSIMSIFEYYRMAIPMFAPAPALLAEWQLRYRILSERTWDLVRKKRPTRGSPLPADPSFTALPDPNNEFDKSAIEFWIHYADFYQWPHVQTFDSIDHLFSLLKSLDLDAISKKVKDHNIRMEHDLIDQWRSYFHRFFNGIPPAKQQRRHQLLDYDAAMKAHYDVLVPRDACVGDRHRVSASQ